MFVVVVLGGDGGGGHRFGKLFCISIMIASSLAWSYEQASKKCFCLCLKYDCIVATATEYHNQL